MKMLQLSELNNFQIVSAKDIQIELTNKPVKYYRHGWQSWSLTTWADTSHLPIQRPAIFHPLQVDAVYADKTHPHGSWLGAVEFEDGQVLLVGALATDTNVSLVGNQLSAGSEAGEVDWLIALGDEKFVFDQYVEQLGIRFGKSNKGTVPRVWCSWYSLYTVIDESMLFETFDKLSDLPFDVLQVDDGWQVSIGDWEANKKFPSGMQALAEKIKSTGRQAGLWLAPLIAVKSSKLFKEHSDWFLHDERGRLVSAGFNWGEQLYALDTTHPDVISWLVALMEQVRAWGFDYLKLDFLYGGALQGKRHNNIPREAAYRESLRVMREAMGTDAFFLTCGTPIIPAIGLCDAIRIGPDVSHKWESYRDAYLLQNPAIPGTKNAIRTVIHRMWLKPLWHIDSDVAYFIQKENQMTQEQMRLLQDLALVCGFKATSDLPQWTTPDERESLRKFLETESQVTQIGRYTFQINDRTVDFSSAVSLPPNPRGLVAIWASFLGWLGDFHFVLRFFKALDDKELKRRRASL